MIVRRIEPVPKHVKSVPFTPEQQALGSQRWIESLAEGHILPWPWWKPVPEGWVEREDYFGVPARTWPRATA